MSDSGTNSGISGDRWAALLLTAAVGIVFANTLSGDFVWDDRTLFVEYAEMWRWDNVGVLLTTQDNLFRYNETGFYRPLVNLSFLVDRTIWGFEPAGFHLTNLVLHALATLAVFRIARRLLDGRMPAAAAGLLFALHPVHTEAVAWINGRNNLLCVSCYLWAFHGYLVWRDTGSRPRLTASAGLLAASVFSKEYAFTFPLLVVLHEVAFGGSATLRGGRMARGVRRSIPYLTVLALYLVVRSAVGIGSGITPDWNRLPERLLAVPDIAVAYARLLLVPTDLTPFHSLGPTGDAANPLWWGKTILLAAAVGLWAVSLRVDRRVFFAFGWIGLTLLPVLHIVPVPYSADLVSERHLYLPSAGFCLLAAQAFRLLSAPRNASPRRERIRSAAVWSVVAAVAIAYATGTVVRNRDWLSEFRLWEATVRSSPEDYRARTNFAIALITTGQPEAAVRQAGAAARLAPGKDTPHFVLAVAQLELGNEAGARRELLRTLALNPQHPHAKSLLDQLRGASGPSR